MSFPKHILDYILRSVPEANSNEEEMLEQERLAMPSLLGEFMSRPSLESQGLPLPTDAQINSPTFKPEEPVAGAVETKLMESLSKPEEFSLRPSKKMVLDVGQQDYDAKEGLAKAQSLRDEQILRHQVNRAGKQIGANISGANQASHTMDTQGMESAGGLVKDYLQKMQMDEKDPNSPISKAFRQFAERYNVKINGDFTAAMGKAIIPYIFKSFEAEENRKLREELAKQKREELSIIKGKAGEEKRGAEIRKLNEKMGTDIDSFKARSNTPTGKAQENINRAERLEALVFKANRGEFNPMEVDNLTPYEMTELAIGLANMLTGGSTAAQSTIKKLTPDTAKSYLLKNLSWLSNKPIGADQQAFTERFANTIRREKQVNQNQINQAILDKAFTTHRAFRDYSPNDFYETLANKTGMTLDEIKAYEQTLGKGKAGKLQTSPSGESVTLRRKSTGTMKKVSQELANKYIESDPNDYEVVK